MELNEQVLEQILTRQRKEYESLLEGKFSRLDTKVGALDAKVGALDTKVGALDTKVGALDAKVNSLDVKIDQTEKRLEEAIVRQGEEYQRYMGVWAEDLKSRIQLTAEGVSALFTEVSGREKQKDYSQIGNRPYCAGGQDSQEGRS